MKRFLGTYAAALLLLPALLLAPMFVQDNGGGAAPQSFRIIHYDADYVVADDGAMTVTERITVNFLTGMNHGIYRFFPVESRNDPHLRRTPLNFTVTVDGQRNDYAATERTTSKHGRFVTYRIGSPHAWLPPGEHTFELRYSYTDALLRHGDASRFYWNVTPVWGATISDATVHVELPAAVGPGVRCSVGWGATGGCDSVVRDGTSFTVTQASIDAEEPMTVRADVAMPRPPLKDEHPWSIAADRALGTSVPGAVIALLLTALVVVGGPLFIWRRGERTPPFPVVPGPPDGVGPAQAAYLLERSFEDRMFVGALLQAAVVGAISLARGDDGRWRVQPGKDGATGDDTITRWIARSFKDREVAFDRAGGGTLNALRSFVESEAKNWFNGLSIDRGPSRGMRTLHGALASLGVLGAVCIAVFGPVVWALPLAALAILAGSALQLERGKRTALVPWAASLFFAFLTVAAAVASSEKNDGLWILPGLLCAACGVATLFAGFQEFPDGGVYRVIRPESRELWSKVGGFRRLLATDSAEDRADFAARKELYAAWLPYAVAFGCADAWARKFPDIAATVPTIAAAAAGASATSSHTDDDQDEVHELAHDLDDFRASADEAISASINAYMAAEHASYAQVRRQADRSGSDDDRSSSRSSRDSSDSGSSSDSSSSSDSFSGGGGDGGGGGGTW